MPRAGLGRLSFFALSPAAAPVALTWASRKPTPAGEDLLAIRMLLPPKSVDTASATDELLSAPAGEAFGRPTPSSTKRGTPTAQLPASCGRAGEPSAIFARSKRASRSSSTVRMSPSARRSALSRFSTLRSASSALATAAIKSARSTLMTPCASDASRRSRSTSPSAPDPAAAAAAAASAVCTRAKSAAFSSRKAEISASVSVVFAPCDGFPPAPVPPPTGRHLPSANRRRSASWE